MDDTGKQIRSLHIVGRLEPGGVTTWLRALLLHAIPDNNLKVDICCNYRIDEGPLAQEFKSMGCTIYRIPLGLNVFSYQNRLLSLLNKNQYDIIHDHRSYLAGASLKAAAKAGIKARIVYHHTSDDDRQSGTLRNIYQRVCKYWTWKYATAIWGCSESGMLHLYGQNWREDKRKDVVYGAVSFKKPSLDARQKIRAEFNIPENDIVIGFICRMTRAKNPFIALEVCRQFIEIKKNVSVFWVGDGPLQDEVRSRINNLDCKSQFHVTGFRKDVPDILAAIDLYLQPSIWEGLPLGTLEALYAGVPIIGSKAPGLLEALPQEYHQYCSEADDIEGHIRAINKALAG